MNIRGLIYKAHSTRCLTPPKHLHRRFSFVCTSYSAWVCCILSLPSWGVSVSAATGVKLFFSLANCKNISVSPKLPVCSRLKSVIWCFPSILPMHPFTDLFPQSNTEMPLPGLLCIDPTRLSFSNRYALGVVHNLLKSKNSLSFL